MTNWKEHTLGDLIDIKHGFAFKGEYISSEPTCDILVTPGNFNIGGGFKHDKYKYYKGEFPPSYILKADDIVVTMTDLSQETDTLGYSAKIPKQKDVHFLHNQRIGLVKFISNDIVKDFAYWLMRTKDYQGFIAGAASGTSIMHTSPTSIKEYKFKLPSQLEQKNIAEVLSSLDDKIDLLHRQNKTLEQLAETLFRQWFVEEADESWEVVKISDVAKINSKTKSKNYPFTEIEYLDTGSITEGRVAEYQTFNLKEAPSRAQRIVDDNDIIYSLVRPIQRHYGLLHGVKSNTIVSTGFCVISSTNFSPHFLYILLTRSENVEYFDMIAEGATSTYPSLKPSDIANFEFQKPPQEKLNSFSRIVSDSWDKININSNQILTLTQLRDTLLPKLMSGEVKVKNNL